MIPPHASGPKMQAIPAKLQRSQPAILASMPPTAWMNQFLQGDCRERLADLPDHAVDLIITSPPYADQRKHTYGGVAPDDYVAWFLPITAELHRVLKPRGSFVLNIKEKAAKGERQTFVLELVLALRKQER